MGKIKTVWFDIDGVLLDSFEQGFRVHTQMAQCANWSLPTMEGYKKWYGLEWLEFARKTWPSENLSRDILEDVWEKSVCDCDVPKAIDGAASVTRLLKRMSYELAVITNRSKNSAVDILTKAGIPLDCFDFFQGSGGTDFPKPNPRVFDNAKLAFPLLNGDEILYVGDTIYDFLAADGADIQFVAVLSGGTERERFLNVGIRSDCILQSVRDLPDFLF